MSEREPTRVYVADAARRAGLDPRTIMRWVERKRITCEREGGPLEPRYLVRLDEVLAEKARRAALRRSSAESLHRVGT